MKGVLLVSHGKMAEGVYDAIKLFHGENPEQVDYLSLTLDKGPEIFKEEMEEKVKTLNDGDGIIIFADLFGGTPSNISAHFASDEVQVISGMNLGMILEYLGTRENKPDYDQLVESGKNSIVNLNKMLKKHSKS